MSREKQIEEMKRECNIALARDCSKAKCLNCKFINEENCDPAIIAEHLYNAGSRKASEVARNIFGNLRILGHVDFDGNICIRKDSFDELEKEYTEEGK